MKTTRSLRSNCFPLLTGLLLALPAAADIKDLLEMSEKLDQVEKQDFLTAIDKANACTRARDFGCTNLQIGKAVKLANGSRDQQMLAAARQNMANEKARIAEEERLRAEEERRLAEAQERLRIAQAQAEQAARQAQEDSGPSTASQLLQLGGMIARNYQTNRAASAAESAARSQAFNKMQADVQAGLARQQQQFAQEKARIEAARQAREQQANTTRLAAANTSSAGAVPKAAAQAAPAGNLPQYQPQQVTLPAWRENCPPGFSPMRHPNGVAMTAPAGAACVRDRQSGSGQAPAQASGKSATAGTAGGGAAAGKAPTTTTTTTTTITGRNTTGGDVLVPNTTRGEPRDPPPSTPTPKKIEWGPIQLEAIAVCRQSQKTKKWECNGALDNQIIVDEPTLESALARQHCAGGTWAAGGPIIDGVQWDAYRCGHSLGAGDYDVAKRYNLITARRSYMCPKYEPGDGRCTTFYDGQDKR